MFFSIFADVMQQNLHGIVLRTVKYGDAKIIVDLLTRELGRTAVIASPSRGSKGKLPMNIFQPLSILEINAEGKGNVSLPKIKEGRLVRPYRSIPFDPIKLSVAFFIAEFLCNVTQETQADVALFDFIENALAWYDLTDEGTANFHLMFMVRASSFLGFYPNTEGYEKGYYFDLRAAEFSANAPLHNDFLRPAESEMLLNLMRITPANMHIFKMSKEQRNYLINGMLTYYKYHIQGFRELKSLDVLRDLFS